MNSKKQKPRRQKHVPQRTCVICQGKVDKKQLTRIVRTPDSGVVVDPTGKRNGRGAYICDQPACWAKALQQEHLLNKALITTISAAEWATIATHMPSGENSGN